MTAAGVSRRQIALPPSVTPEQFQERMLQLPKQLRCVAFPDSHGNYRAVCLDLSLIAQSSLSLRDAQESLVDQIVDYFCDVIEEGCPPHLVNRRVSTREQLSLKAWIALQGFRDLLGVGERASWLEAAPSLAC